MWVQDQVHGFVPLQESISLLCYAAAVSSKVKLGVSVIVFPVRNPVHFAKSLSTLDQMSNGRLILGVGLGPPSGSNDFYRAFGTNYQERVRRFNENLRILKSLWTEDKTNIEGEWANLHDISMEPKPIQKPHPPIWIGGQHPNALRRAVKYGDGFTSAGPTSTEDYKKHVTLVRQYMEEEGRDPADFPISKRVYLAVDDDADRAKSRLDDWFNRRYGWIMKHRPNMVEQICVWGSAARVTEGLADILSGGAETLILNPLWDYKEQMEALASEVIPELQSTVS
jgi:probable F420-dependent oxidoreductase